MRPDTLPTMNGSGNNAIYALLVFFVGALLPMQAAMNATMNRHVGHPIWAAAWNFILGLAALMLLALIFGAKPNHPGQVFAAVPKWALWGGLCGASLVAVALLSAPRLGASLLMACLIAGQVISSLMFDHMGWLGYAQRPLSLGRVAGVVLLGCGVWLIRRF